MSSIKDVAALAGVSIKTVSRILGGYEGVSEKTRKKVDDAILELEFSPSAAAQALRGKGTGIVSLITDELTTTPDSFEIISGIQSICEENGFLLLIGETGGKKKSFEKLVDDFKRQRSQAIIYATVYHREVVIEHKFNRTPLILVNCYEKETNHPTILPNDEQGAYQATKLLLDQGHKRIAFATLFDSMTAAKLRREGYLRAHQEYNLLADHELISEGVFQDIDAVERGEEPDEFCNLDVVLHKFMDNSNPPTAIMFGNDKMAMRAYMILRGEMGFNIPDQISIVGYDNYKLIAENLVPRLTTISLPYFKMGQLAASLAINQNIKPEKHLISGEIIKRGSSTNLDKQ